MIENGNFVSKQYPAEGLTKELERCNVGIKNNDKTNGTGAIVSEDVLLILSCYHIMGNSKTKEPYSNNIEVFLSRQIAGPEYS